jgi:predicted ATP-grasp superfamily ATP-dependent carboligase
VSRREGRDAERVPGTGIARPPALLTEASWYGTLAAVRDLGARGVPVTLAGDELLAPARWSRYATSIVSWPGAADHDRFLDWLLAFGAQRPGHVLYPASDDSAWVVATARGALAARFRLYAPPAAALAVLLDKGALAEAAAGAGLDVAEQWLPRDESEVAGLAAGAPLPLFVKPRTHLLATNGHKGVRVDRRDALVPAWRALRAPAALAAPLEGWMPGVERPLVSRFYRASETIFTVDGFVDEAGDMVALGCYKLLQRPRRLGPGLLFEDAAVPSAVAEGLQRLFRAVGYFGVYDAEFVVDGQRLLLIDVNPRFYNHMAFEIARGLPLPWLAYLGALGDEAALQAAMREAAARPRSEGVAYVHRLPAALMLSLQGLAGSMSRAERRRWRAWIAARQGRLTDPVRAAGDRAPAIVDVLFHAASFLRHPRAFLDSLWGGGADEPRAH